MARRTCRNPECGKVLDKLEDQWLDYDANCIVCLDCRNGARDHYDTQEQFELSIVQLSAYLPLVAELEEG